VCDEGVVWDHYGGSENRRGHENGVTVDLLHGEGRQDTKLNVDAGKRGRLLL